MKRLMNLAMMTTMALLVCSCNNNAGQIGENKDNTKTETQTETVVEEEMYFSYQILESSSDDIDFFNMMQSKISLAVLYGNDNSSNYVMFDDEEDYYNTYIYEWTMAFKIALKLKDLGDKEQINAYLKCVHCLPNCLDKYGIVAENVKETILKAYYDNQDLTIYTPEHKYGSRKYPVDDPWIECVQLYRIKEGEFENVPGGTLGIRCIFSF